MALTQIDLHAALIVIDLQKGIAGRPTVHPSGEVIARATELAEAFRRADQEVVLVNVDGAAPGRTDGGIPKLEFPADWFELVPELNAQPSDHRVTKQRWGAFLGTDLDAHLRLRGVTQVFLVGISTSAGVESTARSAYDLGYNVVLVLDAMTDRSPEAHRNSTEVIFPRLGETCNTADVLAQLQS